MNIPISQPSVWVIDCNPGADEVHDSGDDAWSLGMNRVAYTTPEKAKATVEEEVKESLEVHFQDCGDLYELPSWETIDTVVPEGRRQEYTMTNPATEEVYFVRSIEVQ